MRKRKKMRFKSFFFSQLKYSLFIISICTFVMGFLSYSFIKTEAISRVMETNNELLFQYRSTIDSLFISDFDKMSQMLLEDVKSNADLKYYINNPLEGNVVDTLKVSDYLSTFKNLNPLAYSVAIYYEKNNLLVSTDYIRYSYDNKTDDKILLYYHNISQTMKKKNTRYGFIIDTGKNMFEGVPSSGRTYPDNVIHIVRIAPGSEGSSVEIVISANAAVLQGMIQKYAPGNMDSIIIIDETNKIVSHSDSKYIGSNAAQLEYLSGIIASSEEIGNITSTVNNMPTVLSYQTSKLSGWRYIAFTPVTHVNAVAQSIFKTIIYVAFFTSILCAVISLFAAKYLSKPLRQIALKCDQMPYITAAKVKNEYSLINKTLDDLSEITAMKEMELQEISPMLTGNFISWILSNKVTDAEEIHNKMKSLKVEFAYERFCIAAVDINNVDINNDNENDGCDYEKARITAFLEKRFNTEFLSCVVYNDENYLIFIINYDCRDEILPEICMNAMNEYNNDFTHYIVVGPGVADISNLIHSYNKAILGLGYKYLYPEKHLFTYEEINNYENNNYSNKLLLNNLVNSLKCESYQRIVSDFDSIIESLRLEECSLKELKTILNPLSQALTEFIYGKQSRNLMLINPMKSFSNIIEFSKTVHTLIFEKHANSIKDEGEQAGDIINGAKEYISNNLTDPQLSLESVAQSLNVSSNYLSRYFHSECGITFVGYVSSLKMQHGRKLLLETDMKIDEISKELGYSSSQYFISKFKKQFGYTPNTYRLRYKEVESV